MIIMIKYLAFEERYVLLEFLNKYYIMLTKLFQTYLEWEIEIPKDKLGGATVISLLVFFSYAIVLNTVVPISLYVR